MHLVDHLPLYRQSGIYAREGVDLECSTLADWVGQCSVLLRPLVERLRQHVLGGEKLHADRIADYRISDPDDLLPWNVAAQITKTTGLVAA